MRVVGVNEFGGPEALQVFDVPEPVTGPGEIRIRVHAAAVNPSDTLFRSGAQSRVAEERPPPWVPGMEAAGVVDELGAGVAGSTDLAVGDPVMSMVVPTGPHGGAYAEKVVVPAESVVRQPAGTTHVEACTLPMNGLTAQLTLDLLGLEPGQTLGVTGAAGTYGGYVVQLAKEAGLRVVADASAADEQLVSGFGADVVVRRGDDVAARIREVAPGGVDGLADGALLFAKALPAVRDGGAFAVVRAYDGGTERGITVHRVGVPQYLRETAKIDRLRQLVEAGVVTLRVAGTFAPEQAADAHRRFEAGGVRGRFVIQF
jgi:NADPH:quinone reductase